MNFVRVKKAFTLIELIVVIILIMSAYFLIFSNSNFVVKKDKVILSLENLRETMIKNFEFKDELSFICIEENFECFFKIDGKIQEDSIMKNFFKEKPSVYEYNKEQKLIEFEKIEINNTNQNIIFELKINNDYKINEFILDTNEDKIYVFNSIFKEPKVYSSLNEVLDVLENNKSEVKDAF
jgi:competence protein ComGF